jgi:hypothetical protein
LLALNRGSPHPLGIRHYSTRVLRGHDGGVAQSGESRYPCAVCGDPWMLDAADYVELTVYAPDTESRSWLGAHANCLNKFCKSVPVEIAGEVPRVE